MGNGQDLEERASGWAIKCLRKGSVTGRSKHIVAMATRYSISEGNKISINTLRLINKQGKCTRAYAGLPRQHSGEESTCHFRECQRCGFDPWAGRSPEKENVSHSSILAWTEEPGGLQSRGFQRVGHAWAHSTQVYVHIYTCSCMNTEVLAHTLSTGHTGMQSLKAHSYALGQWKQVLLLRSGKQSPGRKEAVSEPFCPVYTLDATISQVVLCSQPLWREMHFLLLSVSLWPGAQRAQRTAHSHQTIIVRCSWFSTQILELCKEVSIILQGI